MDYSFTAIIEKEFDECRKEKCNGANGGRLFILLFIQEWSIRWKRQRERLVERVMGVDETGKPITARMDDMDQWYKLAHKRRRKTPFCKLKANQSIETITLGRCTGIVLNYPLH
jgi:hypothetical protein